MPSASQTCSSVQALTSSTRRRWRKAYRQRARFACWPRSSQRQTLSLCQKLPKHSHQHSCKMRQSQGRQRSSSSSSSSSRMGKLLQRRSARRGCPLRWQPSHGRCLPS